MAIRNTTHVLKNSDIVNRPLPSSLLKGEPIVNTADGIMYFSGFTTSTNEWTPAGTGTTANFFEVGSNLYDLRLRNQITKYQGQTGSGLVGKFLSGTTSGFVLADISDIAASVDSYTTGATWSPNVLTIGLNKGKPSVPVTIDSFTALTINGNLNVTGTEIVNNLTITGTGLYNTTATGTNSLEIVNYGSLTAFSQTNDVYVTGNTLTAANNDTPTQSAQLDYHGTPIGGPYFIDTENTFTTGGTYNSGTEALDFTRNDGVVYSVSLSGIDINDTYVTGFTYSPTTNTFTISQNEGEPDLVASINTVSGLSFSNLTQGRVVYVGPGGLLTDESTFTYNDGTNTLSVDNIDAAGSVVIQGNLTVLGTINATISGTTSNAISTSHAASYLLTSSFEQFTGSYTTGSFTGSFGGDGSNLINIPASGVTGLNLTRIADGSVTASVSNTDGLRVNSNTEITGALTISGSITLNGVPVGTGKLDEVVFNSYSSSNDTTNSLQNGRLDNLESSTSSLNTSSATSTSTTGNSRLNWASS